MKATHETVHRLPLTPILTGLLDCGASPTPGMPRPPGAERVDQTGLPLKLGLLSARRRSDGPRRPAVAGLCHRSVLQGDIQSAVAVGVKGGRCAADPSTWREAPSSIGAHVDLSVGAEKVKRPLVRPCKKRPLEPERFPRAPAVFRRHQASTRRRNEMSRISGIRRKVKDLAGRDTLGPRLSAILARQESCRRRVVAVDEIFHDAQNVKVGVSSQRDGLPAPPAVPRLDQAEMRW